MTVDTLLKQIKKNNQTIEILSWMILEEIMNKEALLVKHFPKVKKAMALYKTTRKKNGKLMVVLLRNSKKVKV